MKHRADPIVAVRALRSAAPYIRMYKGKVFVIKVGGALFADMTATRAFLEQVAILHQVGIRVVLVHGGGPQLNEMQKSLGIETRMVEGRRITDDRTIDVTVMVLNGLLNTRLLAMCREFEIRAVGLSGVDGGLIRAQRRAPVKVASGEVVDFGFVGDVVSVNPEIVIKALDAGYMPVISPLCADDTGTMLNVNADTIAASIGAALNAEKLLLCTGAPGILERVEDPSSLVSYTDLNGLKRLQGNGSFADGMLPKASAIETAIKGGVRRVHVVSFTAADALLAEVFTNEGTGTLIVSDVNALSPAEQQSGTGN